MQEAVAEERDRVHHERDDGRHRERLVERAQVRPAPLDQLAAHAHADSHRDAREEQRERAGGAARDPEQVVADGGGEHGVGA
jgi:anti-sigma-K factor RskA